MGFTVFKTFVLADIMFLATGVILLAFGLTEQKDMRESPSTRNAVRNLLFMYSPAPAIIVNSGFVFFAFLASIPALILPSARGWLKFFGVMVVFNITFTLLLGLDIWFHTLKTRSEFSSTYARQPAMIQSMIQTKLMCCGYENSTSPLFVTDTTCTSANVASMLGGCVGPFSSQANTILDEIFTSAFAICGVDAFVFLSILCLLQDRKEKERYRHIDEKNGDNAF